MIRAILLSALLVSVLGVEPSAQGAGKAEVLTNQSVLDMVGAKLSKDILLAKLNATDLIGFHGTSCDFPKLINRIRADEAGAPRRRHTSTA